MQSLVVKISNPDTVHAISEAAKRLGTTPEAAALELLETAVLAQKPFEEIVEPIARSFDESGKSEEELDDLVKQTQKTIREERRRNK
jgi:HPt (histidine-containing phosphotransfer) domain-containing protein